MEVGTRDRMRCDQAVHTDWPVIRMDLHLACHFDPFGFGNDHVHE